MQKKKQPRAAAPQQTDRRRLRSEVSRGRIVRAMLQLVGEGDMTPSAEAVATRAGVGLRSVFRHFDNMESLYRQINAEMNAEIRPIAERPFLTREWPAQIDEVIERRVEIFEGIMPYKIAAELHRHQSPFLAEHAAMLTREQRAALDRIVPRKLQRKALFMDSLELVLSFETWRRLRKDQELTVPRARRVITQLVYALLNAN
jgi:AcrR family transcriptional regulator